jgi:hypothetical protein
VIPTAQTTSNPLVSEENPPVAPSEAATAKSLESATLSKQSIPPSFEKAVSPGPLPGSDPIEKSAPAPQSLTKPRRDDRRSSRIPVPQDRQACNLKIGANILPALLVDKSTHGFAVVVDRLDDMKQGKKIELLADTGHYKVRIVYINHAARPEYTKSESKSWFRVGLQQARSFRIF